MYIISKDNRTIVNTANTQNIAVIENDYVTGAHYSINADCCALAYYTTLEEAVAEIENIIFALENGDTLIYRIK